jgi:flavin-dependent dehydrogenase
MMSAGRPAAAAREQPAVAGEAVAAQADVGPYSPRLPLVGDRMMLVGDAAGLINPLNGEGGSVRLSVQGPFTTPVTRHNSSG